MGLYDVPFCVFFEFGNNFSEFPNMEYLVLVEADVV